MTTLMQAQALYLAQQGHGVYSETTPYGPAQTGIALGDMPDKPDRVIVLAGYPMSPEQGSSNQPEVTTRLRVRCRALSVVESWEMCQAISDLYDGHRRVELAGGIVVCNSVIQQVDPLYQGVDKNNRHEHQTVVQFEYLRPSRTR